MKKYGNIGSFRLLDVEVYYENELLYKGAVDNAPEEIKELEYYKVQGGKPMKLYVYEDNE